MSKPNPQALHRYLESARSMRDAWGVYRSHVMPKSAGYGQRVETKRAFYAGADWLFKRLLTASENELDGMQLMAEIGREFQEYTEKLLKEVGE